MLRRNDNHRSWATALAAELLPPWHSCEPVLTELSFVLGPPGLQAIAALLQNRTLRLSFNLADHQDEVLGLMHRFSNVPMSLADACLVRMTETVRDPVVLTTDRDFLVYRRNRRHVVPCRLPR